VTTLAGSVGDRDRVIELVAEADYALHLAHGANQGWEGLRLIDIDGTRNILDGALRGRCQRVVICSSNHAVGWSELDTRLAPSVMPSSMDARCEARNC
jgi:uronate dehydrogenase